MNFKDLVLCPRPSDKLETLDFLVDVCDSHIII
jgi:hypothetical protein